jgi:carnosine N-methyltransferase
MIEMEWEGDFDPMADPEEQRHLLSVLDSFRYGYYATTISS